MTGMSRQSLLWREGHFFCGCSPLGGLLLSYLTVCLLWGSHCLPVGGRSLGSVSRVALGSWGLEGAPLSLGYLG